MKQREKQRNMERDGSSGAGTRSHARPDAREISKLFNKDGALLFWERKSREGFFPIWTKVFEVLELYLTICYGILSFKLHYFNPHF